MTKILSLFRFSTISRFRAFVNGCTLSASLAEPPSPHTIIHNPLPVALLLTSPFVHPEPTLGDFLDRAKFIARGMFSFDATVDWLKVLRLPELNNLVNRHPHILSKLQRPYLHRHLIGSAKLEALRFHYDYVLSKISPEIMKAVADAGGFLLAEMDLGEEGKISARLYYDSRFEKEGELSIGIYDEKNFQFLFTLTFTVLDYTGSGAATFFAGGIQGHKFENQRERIISLTRGMYGLRPKALLVFILQRISQIWGVSSIIAVGDAEHMYETLGRRKEFNSSYDEFWEECDGDKDSNGNYSLPSSPQTRNIADLPSGKRSLYRKRYAMLAKLGTNIQRQIVPVETVSALPSVTAATPEMKVPAVFLNL